MTVDIAKLIVANQKRWDAMKVTRDMHAVAARLIKNKSVYLSIETLTDVPWFVIAVIHEREASGNFNCQLAQGDPLDKVSIHDPKGRGPFLDHPPPALPAFVRGALDALIDCAPYARRWKDWSAGGALTLLEEYNGTGYAARGVPSAYVWSGSDQYVSGKFVADHVYRASAVDVQEGCAPLIKTMMTLDPTISFSNRVTIAAPVTVSPMKGDTMTTSTPVPSLNLSGAFTTAEHLVQTVLPFLSMLFPQIKPFIPLIAGALAMTDDVIAAKGDPQAIVAAVMKSLPQIGQTLSGGAAGTQTVGLLSHPTPPFPTDPALAAATENKNQANSGLVDWMPQSAAGFAIGEAQQQAMAEQAERLAKINQNTPTKGDWLTQAGG